MPWLKLSVARLSQRRFGLNPRPVHVGFVVDKLALGQGYVRVIRFSPVSSIPLVHDSHSFVYKRRYTISAADSVVKTRIIISVLLVYFRILNLVMNIHTFGLLGSYICSTPFTFQLSSFEY